MPFGHGIRTKIIARIKGGGVDIAVGVFRQWRVRERLAVDIEFFVDDFDRLATDGDTALDQVSVGIDWRAEDDDIAGLWVANCGQAKKANIGARHIDRRTVNKFIGQQIVADQQGVFHRARGNIERLHHARADNQRQTHSDENGRNILSNTRFAILAVHISPYRITTSGI